MQVAWSWCTFNVTAAWSVLLHWLACDLCTKVSKSPDQPISCLECKMWRCNGSDLCLTAHSANHLTFLLAGTRCGTASLQSYCRTSISQMNPGAGSVVLQCESKDDILWDCDADSASSASLGRLMAATSWLGPLHSFHLGLCCGASPSPPSAAVSSR